MKPKIAVSIGDPNGIGLEIAIMSHREISQFCEPTYFVDRSMLEQAAKLLELKLPENMKTAEIGFCFSIKPSTVDPQSGLYSYLSFKKALEATAKGEFNALVTLPINKKSWNVAGIEYKGHTDALRSFFKKEAIMMLGWENMYVALFTDHIPLKNVADYVASDRLKDFFSALAEGVSKIGLKSEKIAVLGLNPHAGDGGVLGDEDRIIEEAIIEVNKNLNRNLFVGPLVPDTAFTPYNRERFGLFVAMYHDQGLAPLKSLYFEESINVSLNLPILRVSVDHGTAFDIAYKKRGSLKTKSFKNAVYFASKHCYLRAQTRAPLSN